MCVCSCVSVRLNILPGSPCERKWRWAFAWAWPSPSSGWWGSCWPGRCCNRCARPAARSLRGSLCAERSRPSAEPGGRRQEVWGGENSTEQTLFFFMLWIKIKTNRCCFGNTSIALQQWNCANETKTVYRNNMSWFNTFECHKMKMKLFTLNLWLLFATWLVMCDIVPCFPPQPCITLFVYVRS